MTPYRPEPHDAQVLGDAALPLPARELAYAGAFGAAGLLLPFLFHLLHLGSAFLPMYLPLVTLAFLVGPRAAAATGAVTPLLSAAVTGMPPFHPPVAPVMAVELAVMAALIAVCRRRFPRAPVLALLLPALALGRVLQLALFWLFARAVGLPPRFVAGLSFLSGWPGLLLMLVLVPALVHVVDRSWRRPSGEASAP